MNSNRVISVLLLILSSYIWFTVNGYPNRTGSGPGPDFFPELSAGILAFLALLLFFQKVVKKEEEEIDQVPFTRDTVLKLIYIFIALILYILIAPYIGFLITSVLFIVSWMFIMGERNWKFILLLSIIFSIAITFIFEALLGVPIPHGIIY